MPIYTRKLGKRYNSKTIKNGTTSKRRKTTSFSFDSSKDVGIVEPVAVAVSVTSPLEIQDTPTVEPAESTEHRSEINFDNWAKITETLLRTHIEELSPATTSCRFCFTTKPKEKANEIIFCPDCGPTAYMCIDCCIKIHTIVIYHSPQIWKDDHYDPFSIKYNIYRCDDHNCGTKYDSTIYVVDSKGSQHLSTVQLCRCEEPAVTLMRYRLWCSSPIKPRIAFDIRFMELLATLQLESHLPVISFCNTLSKLNDDFLQDSDNFPKNIYRAVIGDCLREYIYHRSSLKTGHTLTASTVGRECPICKQDPAILSFDGNFGLVHKKSAGIGQFSKHKDLFFAQNREVDDFLKSYSDKSRRNENCSNFQAGTIRPKPCADRLDVSGIFGSVCKHDVGYMFIDMVKGERLGYSIFILNNFIRNGNSDKKLIVMYDIACMLHKHLQKIKQNDMLENMIFAVPVFHSFAHNLKCQMQYGQRHVSGTGLTDGEGIERLWSNLRKFKFITKEMSLGHRRDFLSEALLHHTDKVIHNLGKRMMEKIVKAEKIVKDSDNQIREICSELNVPVSDAQALKWLDEWKSEVVNNKCDLDLNETDLFMDKMFQLQKKRTLLTEQNKSEDLVAVNEEIKLLKSEKKTKKVNPEVIHQHISLENPHVNSALTTIFKKKRQTSLKILQRHAVERQYLLSSLKKYADGQAIWKRINKLINVNSTKMEKEIDNYNAIPTNNNIGIKDVTSSTSKIFEEINAPKIALIQQKAAEAISLKTHAVDEINVTKGEIETFYTFLTNRLEELNNERTFDECNRYNSGLNHYIFLNKTKLIAILKDSRQTFSCAGINLESYDDELKDDNCVGRIVDIDDIYDDDDCDAMNDDHWDTVNDDDHRDIVNDDDHWDTVNDDDHWDFVNDDDHRDIINDDDRLDIVNDDVSVILN